MNDKHYTVVVFFKAKAGKEQKFKEFLSSIIPTSLESPGCIRHDLHQSLSDPASFMFYENWESKEAHQRHIARPEVQKWRAQLNDFLAKPHEITFWEKY